MVDIVEAVETPYGSLKPGDLFAFATSEETGLAIATSWKIESRYTNGNAASVNLSSANGPSLLQSKTITRLKSVIALKETYIEPSLRPTNLRFVPRMDGLSTKLNAGSIVYLQQSAFLAFHNTHELPTIISLVDLKTGEFKKDHNNDVLACLYWRIIQNHANQSAELFSFSVNSDSDSSNIT